ncbi:hypothetical protein EJB05_23815, partial [Eragrostis curvula]
MAEEHKVTEASSAEETKIEEASSAVEPAEGAAEKGTAPKESKALAVAESKISPTYGRAYEHPRVDMARDVEKASGTDGSHERDAFLKRIETEKRMSLIKAWEENEKAKAENRQALCILHCTRKSQFHPVLVTLVSVAQGGQEARRRHVMGELQGGANGVRAQEDPRESHCYFDAFQLPITSQEAAAASDTDLNTLSTNVPCVGVQEQLEMKKAAQAEKLMNAAATVRREAEEKRAAAEARRGEEVVRAEEAAARYRARGQAPTRLFGAGLFGRG